MKYIVILVFLPLFFSCGEQRQVVWIPKKVSKQKKCSYKYRVMVKLTV